MLKNWIKGGCEACEKLEDQFQTKKASKNKLCNNRNFEFKNSKGETYDLDTYTY